MKVRSFLPAGAALLAAILAVRDRFDGLWTGSVDMGLHYIKTSGIAELGVIASARDISLGIISFYPRWAHILAAQLGKWLGSSLIGMQIVVLGALATIWAAIGLGLNTLPRRAMLASYASLILVLLANARWVGLEIHGNEIVGNYFFSHFAAQAAVTGFVLAALWLERLGTAPSRIYVLLGVGVWIADNLHFTPAVVLLGFLTLLVLADLLTMSGGRRRPAAVGVVVVLAATALTLTDPNFHMIIKNAQGNGHLPLRYTGTPSALLGLCGLVAVLSVCTFGFWFRHAKDEYGKEWLLFKYIGLHGLAAALLCGLQIAILAMGSGSEYACRKYALALNTALLLELALLPVALVKRLWRAGTGTASVFGLLATSLLPGVLLFVAVRSLLPDASAHSYSRLLRDEKALLALRRAKDFGSTQGKLDFVVDLGDISREYLFNLTWLRRSLYGYEGLIEVLERRPFSRPELVGRLASREGSPWDLQACRLRPPLDSLVVLDGGCVLSSRFNHK